MYLEDTEMCPRTPLRSTPKRDEIELEWQFCNDDGCIRKSNDSFLMLDESDIPLLPKLQTRLEKRKYRDTEIQRRRDR